jgi:DNA-binding XRE family transcriptional regulator
MTTVGRSISKRRTAQHVGVPKGFEAAAKALGKRIRQLRQDKGWSQERLANEAGMHRTYMWGIERGVRNPSLRHLTCIAEALELPIAALFESG